MFPAGVLDKWLTVPHPYMATVTTGLSNDTDESSHLLNNLAIQRKVDGMIYML